jgi:hypothetical protein
VPRTDNGPDPEALAALLAEHRPKAFFTHSVLHNPTSGNLAPAYAFRVLQLAEQHDFLIVEDDTYGDLHPGAATRFAQFDAFRRTIYVGSYSKTLSGALRVGFFAASPELTARLCDVKIITCVSTSEFSERLVYQMLTEGPYRKFIERVQGRLATVTRADAAPARTLRSGHRQRTEGRNVCLGANPRQRRFDAARPPGRRRRNHARAGQHLPPADAGLTVAALQRRLRQRSPARTLPRRGSRPRVVSAALDEVEHAFRHPTLELLPATLRNTFVIVEATQDQGG